MHTDAGGGTVAYVNGAQHWYEQDIERREEAGTPDVLGSIRCALAMQLHSSLRPPLTHSLGAAHTMRALKAWSGEARIDIVGSDRTAFWDEKRRLPLVSFNVIVPLRPNRRALSPEVSSLKHRRKALLHPQFVAAILSDLFGIQARAGCACAGPYGHVLLQRQLMSQCGCSKKDMQAVDRHAAAGDSWAKPGWVRVYFSFLMTETEVDYIIRVSCRTCVEAWREGRVSSSDESANCSLWAVQAQCRRLLYMGTSCCHCMLWIRQQV